MSKKSDVAKTSDSGTDRQSEKSSTTFRGDTSENAASGLFENPIRAVTPTPEKKPEVHRTSKGKQASQPPVPHPSGTGEVSKVKHLGTMSHRDSQTKESIRPAGNDAPLTSATKTKQRQPEELSKGERKQTLAEFRKRCGIIPGKMTVTRIRTAPEPEQPWMKWTPEEKEKAFDEYRKKAGIIPNRKQVAEPTMSA